MDCRTSRTVCFTSLIVGVLLPSAARADLIVILNDQSGWESAVDVGAGLGDFSDIPGGFQLLGDSFTSEGNTFTRQTGVVDTQQLAVTDGGSFFSAPTTSRAVTDNRSDDFSVAFGTPTTAIGFDIFLNGVDESNNVENAELSLSIFGSGNALMGTFSDIPATYDISEVGFLGITADQPIHEIRWTTTGGRFQNTGVANIRQGTVTAVPEPSAFALLLVAALEFCRRRKTRRSKL